MTAVTLENKEKGTGSGTSDRLQISSVKFHGGWKRNVSSKVVVKLATEVHEHNWFGEWAGARQCGTGGKDTTPTLRHQRRSEPHKTIPLSVSSPTKSKLLWGTFTTQASVAWGLDDVSNKSAHVTCSIMHYHAVNAAPTGKTSKDSKPITYITDGLMGH